MFNKIFKYDFKFFFRIWWVGALSILILSLGCGIMIRGFDNQILEGSVTYGIFVTLAILAIIITAFLLPFGVLIIAAVRYYQNLFSDQGYLTFTLPVKRAHHLNSKLLVYVLFQALSLIVLILSTSIAIHIGFYNTNLAESFNNFSENILQNFGYYFSEFSQADIKSEISLYCIMLIAYFFFGINTLYLSITIGATLAKKHKILAAIGVFYGLNFCINFISQLVRSLIVTQSMMEYNSNVTAYTITYGYSIFSAIFFAILAVVFHIMNLHFIKTKLNLS